MSDFYQNGIVTTLHNLSSRSVRELEKELVAFARHRPMSLVLPSLYSELAEPALAKIVDELCEVPYLSEVIIGLDMADKEQFNHAKEYFSRLNIPHRVLWHDGPRLKALDTLLREKGLAAVERGKGRNVWYCYGYVLASGKAEAIALHDCDIKTYSRDMLARLLYPVANPKFNYEFCKGYYPRVADGHINGRVSRLLVTPLLRALKQTLGQLDYLEYLDSFRYPLAGEFALRVDALNDLRIPSDWGLEIGVLLEIKRNFANNRICQVDIADNYDHKHQPLSVDDPSKGLAKMSIDISKAIFRKLATRGNIFSLETFRTVKATYYRIALDFIESYYNDALINGLSIDRHEEEQAVELFAQNIMAAGEAFLNHPMRRPFIPSWNRVTSAIPDFLERFYDAVETDNA
ncbi:glycosyl transferase [Zooshikella marina]|uniref:Glycosyl transferase n=1 Tax=Zooshikella ganghwensis TaxID=202772 RepID=A0A4P9VPJ0_9GAMM|nr:glycosyl transferase [Zooshikella ganghwensis]MBU2706689.1 glycosyl transferase [Zooshikella ganghwensis]RDH43952.1 glycosyl transferase [Zooshikella ganghwensis]